MSTRLQRSPRLARACAAGTLEKADAATVTELIALVSCEKRELLLRVHRHRLRHEDLEDCYAQATLELLASVRRGRVFASPPHVANALEQRFLSRVQDRRRALSGRSPAQTAIELALPLEHLLGRGADPADTRASVETLAILREELRRVRVLADALTRDQRLVLAAQLGQIGCGEFCRYFGWSAEKYRKVAQRARARLRALALVEDDTPGARHGSLSHVGARCRLSAGTRL